MDIPAVEPLDIKPVPKPLVKGGNKSVAFPVDIDRQHMSYEEIKPFNAKILKRSANCSYKYLNAMI